MGNTDQLFESLFKRNLSANDTKDFLTKLTKEYPWFTAAQFYLLQKTTTDSPEFNKQAAKTAILFNNPFWLNFQLNQLVSSSIEPAQIVEKSTVDKAIDSAEIKVEEKIGTLTDTNETLIDTKNLVYVPIIIEEDKLVEKESGNSLATNLPDAITVSNEKIRESKNEADEYDYEGDDVSEEKEIEPMNIKLDFTNALNTTEDSITFEPLHRSDYFASVGIKLSEEIKPGDKLGKQLKSFTDWLKTMKKIHEENLPQQNGQADLVIQKMAEKSNAEGEILTEAMAEVLLQQGKTRKAIEVYQKLSLLNPAKSAYFANKIDQVEK